MIQRSLIISNDNLKKITQEDIVNYAKILQWEFYYEQDNGTLILNSPKHDGVHDLHQLIIPRESANDAIDCYWDCILHLSHYHNIPYIEIYEKIIGLKYHPDRGEKIDAILSFGEGPDDVMLICNYYGVTRYYDLNKENAQRLGYKLLNSAKFADDLDKSLEEYNKNEKNNSS